MRSVGGALLGLALWALLFVVVPDGFLGLPARPIVIAEGGLEVRSFFGAITAVAAFFVFPWAGIQAVEESSRRQPHREVASEQPGEDERISQEADRDED